MKKYVDKWFLFWLLLAFICESLVDTIAHHKHSSWLFQINWPDSVMMWLKSEYVNKWKYIAGYDGWHTFKGLMLLFIARAFWVVSKKWYYALIFLLMYMIIHELLYGDFLIGGRF